MTTDYGEEGRRQAYLALLGIPLWSARQTLPGALAAAPLEFEPYVVGAAEPEPAVASVADEQAAAPAAAPASSSRTVIPPVKSEAKPVLESEVAPPPRRVAGAETPRLACRIVALAPQWSAVIDLGDAPDLSAQEHRLLGNIAQALGGDPSALPAGDLLRWPLNRNPALDHGTAAMQQWLAHALKLPAGRCLVFGDTAAASIRAALPQQAVTVAPTLVELLAEPAAKRALWQALHG